MIELLSFIMATFGGFHINHTNTEHIIPFPVETGGVTFCFNIYKKVDGVRQTYVECNYVEMGKRKLEHLRDYLENFSAQK